MTPCSWYTSRISDSSRAWYVSCGCHVPVCMGCDTCMTRVRAYACCMGSISFLRNVVEICLKWLLSHKLTLASRSDHCPPFLDQMSEKVVKLLLLYSEVLFVSLIPLRGGSACDLYRWWGACCVVSDGLLLVFEIMFWLFGAYCVPLVCSV